MDARRDLVWQDAGVVRTFLSGVRGAIPLASEQIEAMLRVVEAGDGPVGNVLDLGAGDGPLAAALVSRYPAARVTLVDFSEPMLAEAKRRFAGSATDARFVVADFAEPSWVEAVADVAPFDVVVSGYAVHHRPDERKRTLYREIFGLLRPGGVFVNVEHVASPSERLAAAFDESMVDALFAFAERTGSGNDRARVAEEYHGRPDKAANLLAPVEPQCGWLREAGFEDVDCFCKWFELATFGGRRPEEPGGLG